ncbi:MAG: hypothetical protein UT34_C0001G0387 [candidate division WS6 bacterium GW2011_GWF2_39_15]|uniref:Uncharacterized protein n=1 Tax=candidate division WS6 bacterium GW2011_GWF2_39_15 TaxID=1619100 RepID=A0A0G0QXJ3_9BACT|nr:MAG: hypothetical protein UT34_C0001G0387 [candidate division WS6 bacterium GW2011_GWF2_39_15]
MLIPNAIEDLAGYESFVEATTGFSSSQMEPLTGQYSKHGDPVISNGAITMVIRKEMPLVYRF